MAVNKKPVSGKTVKITTYNLLTPFKRNVKMVNERTTRKPVVKATTKPAVKQKPKVTPKPKPKAPIKPKAKPTKKYRDAVDIPGFMFGRGTE